MGVEHNSLYIKCLYV